MHAGAWPAPARPNPLIPLSLQRREKMPQCTPEGEHAFASQLLARYAGAVDTLVMSTPLAAAGTPLLPSPYLGAVPGPEAAPAAGEQAWRQRRAALVLEAVADTRAPPVGEDGVRGGAGLLESQAACPFRAFARHRLRLAAPEEPAPGLNALERGVLLHGALYSLWGTLGDSATLAALDKPARRRHCDASAQAAMDALGPERRQVLGGACLALEQARLAATLEAWLEIEAARPEPFTVLAREETAEVVLAGLTLRLKLDRVDRLEDGGELVIDYKSGSTQLAGLFRERIESPQLPLYSLVRGPALTGVAFAQLRPRDLRLRAAGVGSGLPDLEKNLAKYVAADPLVADWEGLRVAWRERLGALAGEVMAGEAAVQPTAGACRYCDLASLCRIGTVEDVGDDDGETGRALPGDGP
jgi:probable DNA repair protein